MEKGMSMNSIDIRYIIQEDDNYDRCFLVWDQKEQRGICTCMVRKDAGLIAGTLNRAEEIKGVDDYRLGTDYNDQGIFQGYGECDPDCKDNV